MNTRQIFLDTETTGLNAKAGDRIVELAAVEAINGVLTGRTFHRYLNPERSIDPRAEQVHGLSSSFLKDKPRFSEVADGFIRFVEGAECLMHNAPFDSSFIDAELQAAGRATRLKDLSKIVCTVSLARGHFPGASVSLDSLLERAGHGHKRGKHSALEDARLLAQVYASLFKDSGVISAKPLAPKQRPATTSSPAPSRQATIDGLPKLLPYLAPHFEHYITLERVHPSKTYSYKARGFFDLPVIESTRHAPKCKIGDSWTYIAVPLGGMALT